MKAAVSAIAFALVAGASATYQGNHGFDPMYPTTCAAYTCPTGWVEQIDAGRQICGGPCQPSDCCVPVYKPPMPPAILPIVPEAPKCVPLRTTEGKCVVKGDFDAELNEFELTIGSCSSAAAPKFCGCELKTADKMCVATSEDAVVLRACDDEDVDAQTWEFLANATGKYYFRNAEDLYISADEDGMLIASEVEEAGFFYLESPCVAKLEGPAPAPTPAPTAQTCGMWGQRYQCGGYGQMTKYVNTVCGNDKQCLYTCCEEVKPQPPKVPQCKIACPPGTVLANDETCECVKKPYN